MTLKTTPISCLVFLILSHQSTHRVRGASTSGSKKTEIWQIDVLPGPPHQRPLAPAPSHKLGQDVLSHHDLSGDSFGQPLLTHSVQPLLTQSLQPHFPVQSSGWQHHPDCGDHGKTDVSFLAPIFTLVIGFLVIVPLVGLLALAKMQLWQQLTGGSVTPTVTTTVGGKEDVLARKLSDAWPVFRDAIGKYVNQDSKKVE
ncbi:unnamed protein product [Ixodes hexagonus]